MVVAIKRTRSFGARVGQKDYQSSNWPGMDFTGAYGHVHLSIMPQHPLKPLRGQPLLPPGFPTISGGGYQQDRFTNSVNISKQARLEQDQYILKIL